MQWPHEKGFGEERRQLVSSHSSYCHGYGRKDYESLDYDKCYNKAFLSSQQQLLQKQGKCYNIKREMLSWFSIFIIGFFTALVAFGIDSVIRLLSSKKFSLVSDSLSTCSDKSCALVPMLILIAFNIMFVAIAAALVVFGEPLAAGSGIPEIKCYLNGVKIRHVTRAKTLFCKAVGVLFSVSGGLFVGKEGPMIHSGGVIGAGIPQFETSSVKKFGLNVPYFRSDRDKRDFVSAGAAAGVAAAFGAPIGGVLFSLEEGCSFWSQSLTWKTLFCTMTSAFTLNFFLSATLKKSWGTFSQNGLLTFGVFECPEDKSDCHLWTGLDLLIFVAIGVGGGLFGMLFNFINTRITIFRLRYLSRKPKIVKFLEAVLIGVVTSLVVFLGPLLIGQCKPIQNPRVNFTRMMSGDNDLQPFLCPNGTYNDMATLFFNNQETAIKQLFHHSGVFSLLSLGIFFILFFIMACWTYGASVPSGLFVPCILCGAAYGRFVATLLYNHFGMNHIYLGTFSLIGAAAFLGGVVRMTISLTVILIECTNEISLSLPIMVTLMVAKWVGDLGNVGLYDIHINLKSVPLLEWDAPYYTVNYNASDIMSTRLSFVYPHSTLRSLINLLSTTTHSAFPVVTSSTFSANNATAATSTGSTVEDANLRYRSESHVSRKLLENKKSRSNARELVPIKNFRASSNNAASSQEEQNSLKNEMHSMTFHGLVLRSQLVALIKLNVGYSLANGPSAQEDISHDVLNAEYPRFPSIHDINLKNVDEDNILDITPYMHPCPYVIYHDSPVCQVFNLFRTMGLRHLPVINSAGEILGLITRHNLTHENLEKLHSDNGKDCGNVEGLTQ